MSLPQQALLCLGMVLMVVGGLMALLAGHLPQSMPLFGTGLFLGLGGGALVVAAFCIFMKNLQVAVPGHFLLHPRTGTRFSPHQALAIQRRLDRVRREMSADSVSRGPEPEPPLPSTPPSLGHRPSPFL